MRPATLALLLGSLLAAPVSAAPTHGDPRETGGTLTVWSADAQSWIAPAEFFDAEMRKLDGPTYGRTSAYPPYASVREWQTLVDVLPDGRSCPMVFFHKRWRRLPDVLALDERLRNWDGCRGVFGP